MAIQTSVGAFETLWLTSTKTLARRFR